MRSAEFIKKVLNRKPFFILVLSLILLHLVLILYFQRDLYLEKYNAKYWKDRFEHSQWVLPLSTRPIGDAVLFSYVGYRLVQELDPTIINAETPPLGKYLIGFSILFFNNPNIYGLINQIIFLFLFYFFSKKILDNPLTAIFLTLIVFLEPLIFSQSYLPMVDLFQLNLLLINLICFISFGAKNKILAMILGGLSLGLFTQAKTPILFPLIFLLESIYLLLFLKKYSGFLVYVLSISIGFLAPFIKYFLDGHSLVDFIKLQKYILNFYHSSSLQVHTSAVWQVLILGQFPNIVTGSLEKVAEFSFLWPAILLFSAMFFLYQFYKRKTGNLIVAGLGIFTAGSIIIFMLIPFYPRYLVIITPFLYLFSLLLIKQIAGNNLTKILLFVSVAAFLNASLYLDPKPDGVLSDFYQNLSNQNFQDIYKEDLSSEKPNLDSERFHKLSKKFMNDSTVKYIKIEEIQRKKISQSRIISIVKMSYYTQFLGNFSEIKEINLMKENSQWKINWDFGILLNGLNQNYSVVSNRFVGKRGTIFDSEANEIARDDIGYLISVDPLKYDVVSEEQMLKDISDVTFQTPVRLQNGYLIDNSTGPKDLGTNYIPLSSKKKNRLLSYPGVKIIEYPTRIYYSASPLFIKNKFYDECCTRIYSSYNYHGVKGVEEEYDSRLWGFDGGSITILDEKGTKLRDVVVKDKKDGQDIVIDINK